MAKTKMTPSEEFEALRKQREDAFKRMRENLDELQQNFIALQSLKDLINKRKNK